MEFEWDEAKRWSNLAKHQFDFVRARLLFDGRPIITVASHVPVTSAPEYRVVSMGIVDDRFITVIWTKRGDKIRIISARSARDDERRAYRELYG